MLPGGKRIGRLALLALLFAAVTALAAAFMPAIAGAFSQKQVLDDSSVDFASGEYFYLTAVAERDGVGGVQLLAVGLAADPGWVTETTASGQVELLPYAAPGVTDQAAASFGGRLVIAGGYDGAYSRCVHTATLSRTAGFADYLTPWVTQTAQLPGPRAAAALVVSPTATPGTAYLYLIGGYDGSRPRAEVYRSVFTAAGGEVGPWQAELPVFVEELGDEYGIQYHSAVVFGGHIYVVGGDKLDWWGRHYNDDVYAAGIQSDGSLSSANTYEWDVLTSTLPVGLGLGAAAVYDGVLSDTIYFVGGFDGAAGSAQVYYADILGGGVVSPWYTSTGNLPSPRWRHGAAFSRGQLVVAGGVAGGGSGTLTDTVAAAVVAEEEAGRLVDFCKDASGSPAPGCDLGSWLSGPLLPEVRRSAAMAVGGGEFFVVGGTGGSVDTRRRSVYHGTADAEGAHYPPRGEYASRVFDLDALYGRVPQGVTHLEWAATVPVSSGLVVQYRLATDTNIYAASWLTAGGSISGSNFFTISPPIATAGAGNVSLQYRAIFTAGYPYETTARLTSMAVYVELGDPDLGVYKAARRGFATSGKALSYTIHYSNSGQVGVYAVLSDAIPGYTAIDDAGWTHVADRVYTRALGYIGPGDGSSTAISVVVEKDHTVEEAITDTVQIAYANPLVDDLGVYAADPEPGDNIYTATLLIRPVEIAAAKSVEPHPEAQAGSVVTYTLRVTEVTGSDSATGVVATDTVPGCLDFIDCSPGCTQNGSTLAWNLGELPAGGSAFVTYTARVTVPLDDRTAITNTAYADCDQWPVISNTLAVTVRSQPALVLTKTAAPAPVVLEGEAITFSIRVANAGSSNAYGVVVSDALDAAALENITAIGGSLVGNIAVWNLGLVYVTETARTVVVTATARAGIAPYTLQNRAIASAINATQTVSSSVTSQDVYRFLPVLSVVKTAVPAPNMSGRQPLTFTIRIANTGRADAHGVIVSDTLDTAALENIVVAGGSLPGNVATWSLGTVPTGTVRVVTATATTKDGIAPYTLLNRAQVTGSDLTGTVWSNVTVQNVEEKAFVLEKRAYCSWQANCELLQRGQEVVHTIVAVNNSGVDAEVQVEDVITAAGVALSIDYPPDAAHWQAGDGTHVLWPPAVLDASGGNTSPEIALRATSSPGVFTDTPRLIVGGQVITGTGLAHRVVYTPGPDISITAPDYGGCVYTDTQLSFSYTVKNEGSAPVPIVGGVQVPWTQLSVVYELSGTHPISTYDNLYGYCTGPGLCDPYGPGGWRESYIHMLVPYLQEVPVGYSAGQTLPRGGEKVTLPALGSWTVTLLADAGLAPDYYGCPCDPDDHGWACEPGHEYNNVVQFHYEVRERGQCSSAGNDVYLPLILKVRSF